MLPSLPELPTQLRCEIAIPSGIGRGRILVQLNRPSRNVLEILPADKKNATHQIVNVWGRPLVTFLNEKDPRRSAELSNLGFRQFAESIQLVSTIRPGMTVIDAGAHVGYYSALMAPGLGPGGRILAFEPEPRNIIALTANSLLLRQLFPEAAPIITIPCGLSDCDGTVRLNLFEEDSGFHSMVHGTMKAVEMVPVATMDEALRMDRLEIEGRQIDLLRADVQGSELALFRGGEQTLRTHLPIVCLRLDPVMNGGEATVAVIQQLRDAGYRTFRVFCAHATDPHQILAEAVSLKTSEELIDQLHRKRIGPNGSLFAYPEPRSNAN